MTRFILPKKGGRPRLVSGWDDNAQKLTGTIRDVYREPNSAIWIKKGTSPQNCGGWAYADWCRHCGKQKTKEVVSQFGNARE